MTTFSMNKHYIFSKQSKDINNSWNAQPENQIFYDVKEKTRDAAITYPEGVRFSLSYELQILDQICQVKKYLNLFA